MAESDFGISNVQPSYNKRRRCVIQDTISSFDAVQITQKFSNDDYYNQELILPDMMQQGSEEIDYDVNLISQIQLTPIQQYIHLLLRSQQLWNIEQFNIIVFPEYIDNKGIISLKQNMVIYDTLDNSCKTCISHSCIHSLIFEKCFYEHNDIFYSGQPFQYKDNTYYILDSELIVIFDTSNDIHIFRSSLNKWSCNSCNKICHCKIIFDYIMKSQFPSKPETTLEYKSITSNQIPFSLNEQQCKFYEQQLTNGFKLSSNLIPEIERCQNGFEFSKSNLKLERQGVILYIDNEVRELKDHNVYSSYCNGHCHCKGVFNGENFLLLNLDNHYLIHYSLLYEYSELMTVSKNPLFSYIRAKNNKLIRMGRKLLFKYHIVQKAWNVYLRIVDIDYQNNFQCPTCVDKPSIIILDGIAMGTTKLLPSPADNTDYSQKFPIIPLSERTFLPNLGARKALFEYANKGIATNCFDSFVNSLQQPELSNYILFTSEVINSVRKINTKYEKVDEVVKTLSRVEAITALYRFSAISGNQRKLIMELSHGNSVKQIDLIDVFNKMKPLEVLINSIKPTFDNLTGCITLHDSVAKLLSAILKKFTILINKPTRMPIDLPTNTNTDFFNYFPSLPCNYKIPHYDADNSDIVSGCTKLYPKHQKFSPGFLAMACQHRYCYGFEIMTRRESTVLVFNMLLRNFKVPPSVIIYDNACNLQSTYMMRDPALFRSTTFLVDRFHNKNHICSPIFSMKTWNTPEMEKINSQICEQLFSSLRRIGTQVAYMRIENIYYNTRYFLACCNKSIKLKDSEIIKN